LARPPVWPDFAANPQHAAQAPASPQPLAHLHWTARIDHAPPLIAGTLPIHYASPLITQADTVLVPVRADAANWFRIEAHDAATGTLVWSLPSDYQPPPSDWIPPLPVALTANGHLAVAGAGGTVLMRGTPDTPTGTLWRAVFYGTANWEAYKAAYSAAVRINTPITADATGDLFYGFAVNGATPTRLISGLARIGADGTGTWISATEAAGDPAVVGVAQNAAPALSPDGATLYVVVTDGVGGTLLALDAKTLARKGSARLLDPVTGQPAWVDANSSASPTVGPDGDVYFGVLESDDPAHDDRGWLLHFDATLAVTKIPGSFGWDTTASVLPAASAPFYHGTASYLLVTKYNNYLGAGLLGDGRNRIALLDPTQSQPDGYSTAQVMREVETVLEPVAKPGGPPGSVYEWCISSAVVDPRTASVIANAEDGRVYRWDLATNTLSQSLRLNPPRLEAYTATMIGPDGTVYVMNNATLYAIGR
jgi:hypothetical protein